MRAGFSARGLTAAVLTLAVDALYIEILLREGEGDLDGARARFVATAIGAAALCTALGSIPAREALRLLLLSAGGFGLLALALLGAASLGMLLLIPAILALSSASRLASGLTVPAAWVIAATGGLVAASALVAGVWLTG